MKKATIAAILIIVILAGAAFGVIVYASDWFKLPVDRWGDRLGIGDNETPGDDDDDNNPPITGDGEVMDPDGVNVMPASMIFSTNALESEIGNSVQITATFIPEGVDTELYTCYWSAEWANSGSEWANGKQVKDYVTVTADIESNNIATVECLQPFGEQVLIKVVVRGTDITKNCTVDYEKRDVGIQTTQYNYENGEEYELFGDYVELIGINAAEINDYLKKSPVENPFAVDYGVGTITPNDSIVSVGVVIKNNIAEAANGFISEDFVKSSNLWFRDITDIYMDNTFCEPGSLLWMMWLIFDEYALEEDVYIAMSDSDYHTSLAMLEDNFYQNSKENNAFDFCIIVTTKTGNQYFSGFGLNISNIIEPTDVVFSPGSIIF